jgi:lyso-ornithine lipid O-acyltransferase
MIGWARLVIALFCVLLATLLLVPVQLLAMRTRWYSENFARGLWHRINVRALGLRIHVVGEMTPLRPLLIASNHISWTDIEVMASLFDMTFIAKSDIDTWPVIGKLFRLQRPIYVERNRKRRTGEQASEIAKRMDADQPIVLFPEGTTGDGNMILPFKSSLFGAAAKSIESGIRDTVHVQPVAIVYTRINGVPMGRLHRPLAAWIGESELLPHLTGLLRGGGVDVELHFGAPVAFSSGTNRKEAAKQVERQVRAMMQAALRDPRPSK